MSLSGHVQARAGGFTLDVRLSVADGEVLAVLGPNGAGKTTLLRTLAGLAPLSGGSVRLGEEVLEDPAAGIRVATDRRRIGVVFADQRLFPHLSARDNVAFGPRSAGLTRRASRALAGDWLAALGLSDLGDRRPDQLSGGQAQRVALARALAGGPAALLLDEPLSALDASTREDVRALLREQLSGFTGPALVVTHDLADAATLADRVVVVQDGAVVQRDTPPGLVRRPRTPYVADLVGRQLLYGTTDGSVLRVDAAGGGGRLVVDTPCRGPVAASFRPAAVVLASAGDPGSADPGSWTGRVAAVEHRGDVVRVRVEGAPSVSAELDLADAAALAPTPGRPVTIRLDPRAVEVYPRRPGTEPGG